ncbi:MULTISPECIES: TRAP transporter small permease [unclassified Salipiger]|uniref:TRAP transporter small permease n=1 Tax=unclassified Salipiger TaxID=2640570 RepID=UPI0013BE3697|nr:MULTISPECIES: TRAP transporter small permease subunit [unclassified Salipiger]NDV51169.1 TRAP transporter small permease subunit [Salipiger sp. PrR003]NDW32938.1 TRAP transporter small permease subunit [Salipiger sp. PrR007]
MERLTAIGLWLRRRAENIAALMLAVMFVAFIVQVAFRYLLNLPVGGASELTIIMWLWLVLWGASFVLKEREEIRFDFLLSNVGPKARRVMSFLACAALLFLYGYSLPAVWDFVTFMKIQETSYLDIRYDWVFSIYVIFAVATLLRYAWLLLATLRGRDVEGARSAGAEGDQ